MTPYDLSILLDVFVGRPVREDRNAPIYTETIARMHRDGWITTTRTGNPVYEPTQKLAVFIGHVLYLPEPVWRMP